MKTEAREGVLKKKNPRGQWQERFFVQSNGELRYYESAKKDKEPKGVIKLAGILQVPSLCDPPPPCTAVRSMRCS